MDAIAPDGESAGMGGLNPEDAFGEMLAKVALDMYTMPYGTPSDLDQLPAVKAAHGARWKIDFDKDTGVWIAVRKTVNRVEVHAGHTLTQLAAKLDAEDTAS